MMPRIGAVQAKPGQAASDKTAVTEVANGGDPELACKGRVLLGFQMCMNEQCVKPEFANHAVCEQRRIADQTRRQDQLNRN